MADKKKMTVAEILAAARKMDSKEGEGASDAAADDASHPNPSPPPPKKERKPAAPAGDAPAKLSSPAPKTDAPAGERPSVADILAMARGKKEVESGAESRPEPARGPTPKPEKPQTKAVPKTAVAAVKRAEVPGKDTASILAVARKPHKPGPMTKAEAEARAKVEPKPAKPAKPEITVPPMPIKPASAKPRIQAPRMSVDQRRRSVVLSVLLGSSLAMGFAFLAATLGLWTLALARFMFPNILREPPSRFKVGFPGDLAPGQVETKFQAQFAVWVVSGEYNGQSQVYALKSVCTHLGCTPNWLDAEQKFKCPCHGSGFYKDGINFEGPAPRPLERYAIRLADDGQLEIDKSRTFQEELGQWQDPASFVSV